MVTSVTQGVAGPAYHGPVIATSVIDQLQRLSRRAGGSPLLTHYGPGGERTELAVASFANWVNKTTNLLEELDVEPGAVVELPVLASRPGHWMALVWPFALWQAGVRAVVPTGGPGTDADLVVVGPDAVAATTARAGRVTVACSLDPWGRGLDDLPDGVVDFSSEALAQPDAAYATPLAADAEAWVSEGVTLRAGELAGLTPVDDRVLVCPATASDAVAALARVVLGGGSLVVVEDADDARLERILQSEKARAL